MVDHPQITGTKNFASIGNIWKAYKSLVSKWSLCLHNPSSKNKHDSEAQSKSHDQSHKGLDEKDEQKERTVQQKRIHSFRYNNGDAMRGAPEDPTSPRSGLFKHRKSVDNFFPFLHSPLSRSSSRKSNAGSGSRKAFSSSLSRSGSRRSTDSNALPEFSKSASRRSSANIMFSKSMGMVKTPSVEKKLECTLEDLCYGCMKKVNITRDVLTNTGQIAQEDELLTIKVKPGWKNGTKITFEGMGNERPGSCPADITFVVSEQQHPLFRREDGGGDDLELAVEIPLVEALTGCTVSVPLLGGGEMKLTVEDTIIFPGYQEIVAGQGMQNLREEGKRGDLKVTFLVNFPTELTEDQRVDVLSILEDSAG